MEEKQESCSFQGLIEADSGLTLINADALIRETELQERQLNTKDKKIEELNVRLEHLEDIVQKCKLVHKEYF